jgi:death on curing protein
MSIARSSCRTPPGPRVLDGQQSRRSEGGYSTIHEKAAALLEAVVRNHALVDGNKRLGWAAAVVFYDMSGLDLDPPSVDEAVELMVAVAGGQMGLGKLCERLAPRAHQR